MNPIRALLAFVIGAVALLLGGCATASNSAAMIAPVTAKVTKHPEALSVNVTGGSETSAMWKSMVSDADFAEAIKASVTQSGLFAKIAVGDAADYQLEVQIVRLVQPNFGASFTVTIETSWFLKNRRAQKVIWQKSITTSYTASMGDAIIGATRLRLANEGAARSNIQDAINQMSALTLP